MGKRQAFRLAPVLRVREAAEKAASRASAICAAGTTAVATREIDSSTSMAGKWPVVASFRVSTMWPSRIDRAVSAIGSLWSSPSTRTV